MVAEIVEIDRNSMVKEKNNNSAVSCSNIYIKIHPVFMKPHKTIKKQDFSFHEKVYMRKSA